MPYMLYSLSHDVIQS